MKFGVILEILQKHEKHENYFDVTENLCYKVHIQRLVCDHTCIYICKHSSSQQDRTRQFSKQTLPAKRYLGFLWVAIVSRIYLSQTVY